MSAMRARYGISAVALALFVLHAHRVSQKLQLAIQQVREQDRAIFSLRKASRDETRQRRVEDEQWAAVEKNGRKLIRMEEGILKKDLLLLAKESFQDIGASVLKEVKAEASAFKSHRMTKGEAKTVCKQLKQLALDLVGNKSAAPIEVRDYFVYLEVEQDFLSTLVQDNAYLVEHVRRRLMLAPSPRRQPYLLEHPNKMDRTNGQLAVFLDIFQNQTRGGFFIEFRARDGERESNTLDLESRHNWTGVLVEPSPFNFGQLLAKKRKAHIVPTCLSWQKNPAVVNFTVTYPKLTFVNSPKQMRPLAKLTNTKTNFDILCMPFYTIYKAAAPPSGVDLFILDADGREMQILSTIPWHEVNISVLMVKFLGDHKLGNLKIYKFMQDQKFRPYQGSKTHPWSNSHHLFIRIGSRYDVKHP